MPTNPKVLKAIRKTHLYSGLFIAPLVIFLSLTGAMQALNLHEATPDGAYKPAHWMLVAAQVHKNQTAVVGNKKPKSMPKPDAPAANAGSPQPAQDTPGTPPNSGVRAVFRYSHHLPLKIFFALASLLLVLSTVTGVYMAYKFARKSWVITAWLAAGVVVPLLLLRF